MLCEERHELMLLEDTSDIHASAQKCRFELRYADGRHIGDGRRDSGSGGGGGGGGDGGGGCFELRYTEGRLSLRRWRIPAGQM